MRSTVMNDFEIDEWRTDHSTSVERRGSELVFTHVSGETSVLLPRDPVQQHLLPAVCLAPLASFYRKYVGASVGDSQLVIAATAPGGVDISHGFRLPDLAGMDARARSLGVAVGAGELTFMTEAAWMFFYTVVEEGGRKVLRKYDRDVGSRREVGSLEQAFEDWWRIVLAG